MIRQPAGGRSSFFIVTLLAALATLAACGRDDAGEPRARLALAPPSAQRAYDVALAQAEGAHASARERCTTLAGDAQRTCNARADADLDYAKRRARAIRDAGT